LHRRVDLKPLVEPPPVEETEAIPLLEQPLAG